MRFIVGAAIPHGEHQIGDVGCGDELVGGRRRRRGQPRRHRCRAGRGGVVAGVGPLVGVHLVILLVVDGVDVVGVGVGVSIGGGGDAGGGILVVVVLNLILDFIIIFFGVIFVKLFLA